MAMERVGSIGDPQKEIPNFNVERVFIAGNRGPCGGVVGAIEAAYLLSGEVPLRTNNDVVHNIPFMKEMKARDFINVGEDWKKLSPGTRFLWSAHGHTKEDELIASQLGLETDDTTCSLVIRVQLGVERADRNDHFVAYIGKKGHPETRSVMSRAREDNRVLIENKNDLLDLVLPPDRPTEVFSQTTLMQDAVGEIEDELVQKWPNIIIHKKKDLCDATLNRQEAVKALAPKVDMLFVVGSPHSDNSNAIRGVGEIAGIRRTYIFDYPHEIQSDWFSDDVRSIGLTSGASVLDRFMLSVVDWLRERNPNIEVIFEEPIRDEYTSAFKLPKATEEKLSRLRQERGRPSY